MKTAILFGASGNIGSNLLKLLLQSSYYQQVKVVVRQALPITHPKLLTIIADYHTLPKIKEQLMADDVFIIIGSSDKTVERNYPVLAATLCKEAGAQNISVVTVAGANSASWLSFTKIKGEIEQDITALNFNQVHLFRPGMILGARDFYRPLEKTMMRLWRIINPLLVGPLTKFKGMEAQDIARAMFQSIQQPTKKISIYHWQDMHAKTKKALS